LRSALIAGCCGARAGEDDPMSAGPAERTCGPGLDDLALIVPQPQRLLFAVTHVPGSTLGCAARGDAAMFATLQAYYTLAAEAADGVGGRFIKGIGDGVLLTFPPERAPAAVQALRAFQERANALWPDSTIAVASRSGWARTAALRNAGCPGAGASTSWATR
jgi:class 3 adenylate cyclase